MNAQRRAILKIGAHSFAGAIVMSSTPRYWHNGINWTFARAFTITLMCARARPLPPLLTKTMVIAVCRCQCRWRWRRRRRRPMCKEFFSSASVQCDRFHSIFKHFYSCYPWILKGGFIANVNLDLGLVLVLHGSMSCVGVCVVIISNTRSASNHCVFLCSFKYRPKAWCSPANHSNFFESRNFCESASRLLKFRCRQDYYKNKCRKGETIIHVIYFCIQIDKTQSFVLRTDQQINLDTVHYIMHKNKNITLNMISFL